MGRGNSREGGSECTVGTWVGATVGRKGGGQTCGRADGHVRRRDAHSHLPRGRLAAHGCARAAKPVRPRPVQLHALDCVDAVRAALRALRGALRGAVAAHRLATTVLRRVRLVRGEGRGVSG